MEDKEKYSKAMNKLHSSFSADTVINNDLQKHSKGFKPAILSLAVPVIAIISVFTINSATNGSLFGPASFAVSNESSEKTTENKTDSSYIVVEENQATSDQVQSAVTSDEPVVITDGNHVYLIVGEDQFDVNSSITVLNSWFVK